MSHLNSRLTFIHNAKIWVKLLKSCLEPDKIAFNSKSVVNLLIAFELDTWLDNEGADFALEYCLFQAVK